MTDEKLIEEIAWALAGERTAFPAVTWPDYQDAARAALAVVRKYEGWQPIETAPKDVSVIFADALNIIPGWWQADEDEPRMIHTGGEFPIWPTHWRPLPTPPVTEKEN